MCFHLLLQQSRPFSPEEKQPELCVAEFPPRIQICQLPEHLRIWHLPPPHPKEQRCCEQSRLCLLLGVDMVVPSEIYLAWINKRKKMLICFYFWYNNSSGSFLIFKVSSMHALSVKVKFPLMHRFLLMTPTFQGLRALGGIFGFFQGISNSVWSLGYFCSLLNALLMEQTLASPQPTPTHCIHSLQQETQTGGGKIVQPWSTGLVPVRP